VDFHLCTCASFPQFSRVQAIATHNSRAGIPRRRQYFFFSLEHVSFIVSSVAAGVPSSVSSPAQAPHQAHSSTFLRSAWLSKIEHYLLLSLLFFEFLKSAQNGLISPLSCPRPWSTENASFSPSSKKVPPVPRIGWLLDAPHDAGLIIRSARSDFLLYPAARPRRRVWLRLLFKRPPVPLPFWPVQKSA